MRITAFLNFGKADQKALDVIRINEARRFIDAGHFSIGSMLPKINAALDFLESGGTSVIITSPKLLKAAIRGNAGTRVYR